MILKYILFNKNKEFIGYADEFTLDQIKDKILWKEIPEQYQNPNLWRWVGDYDTGKFVALDCRTGDPYPVEKLSEEARLLENLERRYAPFEMLYLIAKQLYHFAALNQKYLQPDFEEMFLLFNRALAKYQQRCEFFKESEAHEFITPEQIDQHWQKAFSTNYSTDNGNNRNN